MERKAYEVAVEDGKLLYKETGELLDTLDEPKGCKWIFVLSTWRTLYVGKKKKGSFQHSSFLSGGATLAAGRIVADKGVLKAVWPHSGHYRPTAENFEDFISFLKEYKVDLNEVEVENSSVALEDSVMKVVLNKHSELHCVQMECVEGEEIEAARRKHVRNVSWGDDLTERERVEGEELVNGGGGGESTGDKLTSVEIASEEEVVEMESSRSRSLIPESTLDEEEEEEEEEESIPEEHIMQRINSHKGMNSYQLGKQLCSKWSTGAGPRIGCLRDYPSGLQTHALEQVDLSPRSRRRLRLSAPSGSNLSLQL